MAVCAPTGSGKTVVFEMAIVQLLMDMEDKNYTEDFKIIYMAPVKALCTERLTEWYPKFTRLGLFCIEVTGDTNVEFPQLKPYRIIITTPEKWDMLTRRWRDHRGLVEVVKLFLIDEVHILNDDVRGPVLEAVVSRMKTIESSVKSAHRIEQLKRQYQNNEGREEITTAGPRIRFVAVSATVNNPEDVAQWLGTAEKPAVYYKFGDECRPVKLKRVVEGYSCPAGTSIFKFDIILNYKLWPIIQKYHNGKPTLIFCNTRKSVALTAETLSREITVSFNPEQKAKLTALASTLKNKKLQTLILNGVGCHHAGLLFEERLNIEQAFRNRDLPILITTTTLAMGVNLPAHLVIIKNTQQYVNGAYQEYSISTILQMVGRAGRPQFDTEATAVIMTRMADKARYQALVEGTEPLQSFLHKRLAENLNSEAALQTVTDVAQCVEWVNSTFLSVRAAKDPRRYLGLPQAAPAYQISKKIEELCVKAMNGLASSGLIIMDEACCIESTEAGKLMSVYYIDLETMKLIMKIEGSETLERLLWLVCESHELSDMHLRVDERRSLNALNRNNNAATIRFPMKGKINSRQMKLNCVIQAVFGCLPIPDPSLNQEAMKIMRIADRVCKCLVAYTTRPTSICQQPKTFSAVLNSIILTKCIAVHLWENSQFVSKQLRGIGPTFSMLLASAGKVNFMVLEESHPRDLERIMNKGPPAGNVIRKQISLLPKYQITITPIDRDRARIQLILLNQSYLSENMDNLTAGANHKSYIIIGDSENYLLYLNSFKDTDLIRVYDGCITCEVTRKHNFEHKITAYCISSNFVGIDVQNEYLFMDVAPMFKGSEGSKNVHDNSTKTVSKTSFEIEQIPADRKRKVNNIIDVTCSKEKIKRDNNLIKKFNCLKESFGKASKELRGNFNKTTEMSNKILHNLKPPESNVNINTNFVSDDIRETIIEPNYANNFAIIDSNDDLFEQLEDDNQVNNILYEIENEIGRTVAQQNVLETTEQPTLVTNENKNDTSNYTKTNETRKLHKKQVKSNYNFIDVIDKNNYTNEENDDIATGDDGGFANTVKLQIEKYLQHTKFTKPRDEDINIILETENKKEFDNSLSPKAHGDSPVCCNADSKNIFDNNTFDDTPEEDPPMLTRNNEGSATTNYEVINEYVMVNDAGHNNTTTHLNPKEDKTNFNTISPLTSCLINNNARLEHNINENVRSLGDMNLNIKAALQIQDIQDNIGEKRNVNDVRIIRQNLKEENQKENNENHFDNNKTKTLQAITKFAPMPSYSSVSQNIIEENSDVSTGTEINMVECQRKNTSDIYTYKKQHLNPKYNLDNSVPKHERFKINEGDTNHIDKYSYQATKLDVCTKNGTKHTVKVIRKVKIDFDITRIISTIDENPMSNEVANINNKDNDIQNKSQTYYNSNMAIDFQPSTLLLESIKDAKIKNVEKVSDEKSIALQNSSNIQESTYYQSRRQNYDMNVGLDVPEILFTNSEHPNEAVTNNVDCCYGI
ncbi:probable ATP-dependent DNA helicase HFM1 [Epargyreus clarus]|uniref:probable ATP-dependent DNA helicase HFM1 n=1 Tax=Epargyreus clarus TaxID=520877 RepID=UPI003C2BD087